MTPQDPFTTYLQDHSKEFLELRLQRIGFDRAMQIMKERFEKEKEQKP